jgi:hypothetical protein
MNASGRIRKIEENSVVSSGLEPTTFWLPA